MAQNNLKVLLGFQDELIVEKHNGIVNFTTNKIGGRPDWPTISDVKISPCPLCQLPRPLVLQIYAPLDNSPFHRTLYLFACINPNCWNQSESWLCLRSQILEQNSDVANVSSQLSNTTLSVTDWCQDADDWDDNNANFNEENGNSINQIVQDHPSDDEEESCSFEEVVRSGLAHLTVDERNANTGAIVPDLQGGGAVGRQNSPTASAEIEVDESEIVTIDTPTAPQNDIASILQEVTPLPQELCQRAQNDGASASILQFLPSFISVGEENTGGNIPFGATVSDHHIRDLLQEYQQNNEDADNFQNAEPVSVSQNDLATLEKYEKSIPAHGDKMFHDFLTKIQLNPGQILRYSRNGPPPLLISPLQDIPRKCKNCQGEMIFELQILPTLIPKLRLQGAEENNGSRIEFGTVLVYTCIRSCWSSDSKVRDEEVVVQSEKY